MKSIMQKLCERAKECGPLCVGLDTDVSYIPENILKKFPARADAVFAYNREIIERLADEKIGACCKVQIAYYEALGIDGMRAYSKTLLLLRGKKIPVIADVKRGDIASTADAYARAHFSGDFEADIITVNPYMGFDTISPFEKYLQNGKGIFVLLRTSNEGMRDIEGAMLASGKSVYEKVGSEIVRLQKKLRADEMPAIGAVVGCTDARDAKSVREKYAKTFFLIPGFGAQGGKAETAKILLQNAGGVVNSSRAILCAWRKTSDAEKNQSSLSLADIADCAVREAKKENAVLRGERLL